MNKNLNLYRRNGQLVYIKSPEFNELSFVKDLWADKRNMDDLGEGYFFPKDKWDMFYKKMINPTDGKNFYCLVYDLNENPIGEVSFHGYNSATKVARINIKIHYDNRRNGYGEEALRLLLEYYFFEFGGEAIIDSTTTSAGKALLKKIGFEELNNFRNQGTYKLTKKRFLNCKIKNKKTIAILKYENISLTEYSIIFYIFNKVNEILNEKYFELYTVSDESDFINEEFYPDIVFIPGGEGVKEAINKKRLFKYIEKVYSQCNYIATFSNGLYFLNGLYNIKGISIPNCDYEIENVIKINKNFVDNGKIMISSNLISHIELCINIVKKVAGDDISIKLSKALGCIY